jgi:uncharacterized protein with ParB-like and HNH nuclease domain
MRATEKSVRTLLTQDVMHAYAIPTYQREYRWKLERWEQLLEDIQQNHDGYFIGALIFIRATPNDGGLQEFNVVDGQQRLATVSIMLAALYRATRERIESIKDQLEDGSNHVTSLTQRIDAASRKINKLEGKGSLSDRERATLAEKRYAKQNDEQKLKTEITNRTKSQAFLEQLIGIKAPLEETLLINELRHNLIDRPRLKLSGQKEDNTRYRDVLKHCGVFSKNDELPGKDSLPMETKRHNIGKCFRYFYTRFSESKNSLSHEELVGFHRSAMSLQVVDIKADSNADAYVLFESLNNRGEPLTGLDLIKNSILADIDDDTRQGNRRFAVTLHDASIKWNNFVQILSDPKDQEKFLRHLYLAFKTAKPEFSVNTGQKITARFLISDIYPTIAAANAEKLLTHFIDNAAIYAQIAHPQHILETAIKRGLMSVLYVEAIPARILLLYLLVQFPGLKREIIPKVSDDLVKFFIRRHLTDVPKTRNLDDLFVEIVDEVVALGATATSSAICDVVHRKLRNSLGDLAQIKTLLAQDIDKSNFARVLLGRIEVAQRSPEDVPDLWAQDANGNPTFTLEHILPQGNLSSVVEWRTAISPDNPADAEQVQSDFCQKLGNLTLTSFNTELSNSPFIEKRDSKRDGQSVGYRNGLRLNAYVKEQIKWGPSQIIERGNELSDVLIKTLLFDGEAYPYMPGESETVDFTPTI